MLHVPEVVGPLMADLVTQDRHIYEPLSLHSASQIQVPRSGYLWFMVHTQKDK